MLVSFDGSGKIYQFAHCLCIHSGGVWLDNDAIPLTNLLPITLGVGLQFAPRHMDNFYNNHVMFGYKHSRLSRRKLETILYLPMDRPDVWPQSVRGSMHAEEGWVYNSGASAQVHIVQDRLYARNKQKRTHVCMYVCLYVCMYVCMYFYLVCMYVWKHSMNDCTVCMVLNCVCMQYVCLYVYVCVCMCMYVCMYVHRTTLTTSSSRTR